VIDAVVNQLFQARVVSFPPGLTGTVAVRIVNSADATVYGRSTSGVTEDPDEPGAYLATLTAPNVDGLYRIIWDYGTDADASEDIDVVALAYSPSVSDVAALVPSRPKTAFGRIETFTQDTQPTANQVTAVVDRATRRVHMRLGTAIPASLVEDVRNVIALRAAMLVELTYFGDQIKADRTPYTELKALHDEAFAELIFAWKNLGPDAEPGTVDDVGSAGMPSYDFPIFSPAPHACGSEIPNDPWGLDW
jgi:hypothetical protein